ncbi:MAG: hypothetical protein U1F87_04535 [Kiritimatiellia bacterium]
MRVHFQNHLVGEYWAVSWPRMVEITIEMSVVRALHGIHERYGRYPLQSSPVDHAYDGIRLAAAPIARPCRSLLRKIRSASGLSNSRKDMGARGMIGRGESRSYRGGLEQGQAGERGQEGSEQTGRRLVRRAGREE